MPIRSVVVWWMLFLLLTVAGERLELRRILRPEGDRPAFLAALAVLSAGAVTAVVFAGEMRILGLGLLAMALWLVRYDIARRTVRGSGLIRFAALCLLSGYVWLALSGAIMLGVDTDGLIYDAVLHAFFLGFVFAMVFAHAPIILPAVTRLAVTYRPVFYLHLIALQLSLLLRLAGDLAEIDDLRLAGGIGNALALLLFLMMTVGSVHRPAPARKRDKAAPPQDR